jgi:hypothetical protein
LTRITEDANFRRQFGERPMVNGSASRRRFSRPWLLICSLVLSVSMAWPVFRWFRKHSKPPRVHPYGLCLVDDADRPLGQPRGLLKVLLDPFTVYRLAPNQRTEHFTINAWGGRGPLPESPKGSGIAILGSSAAFGQELSSDSETFSSRIHEMYPDHQVYNFAVPGFLAGQELALYIHRLRDVSCHLVIVFDGWNEIFDAVQGAPRRPAFYGFNSQFFEVRDRLAAWHAGGTAPSLPPPDVSKEDRRENTIRDYLENIRDLHHMVNARGAKLLWVIQPELGSRTNKTPFEHQIIERWKATYRYNPDELTSAYRVLRKRAREFAHVHAIPWIDINDTDAWCQSTETVFADAVHPNAQGHRLIAGILVKKIRDLLPPCSPAQGSRVLLGN